MQELKTQGDKQCRPVILSEAKNPSSGSSVFGLRRFFASLRMTGR